MKKLIAIVVALSLMVLILPLISSAANPKSLLWGTSAKLSSANSTVGNIPDIEPDGRGGAIFVWEETNATIGAGARIQRVDKNGVNKWGQNGKLVSASATVPIVKPDLKGNFIVIAKTSGDDFILQKYSIAGTPLWGAGTTVSASSEDYWPRAVADGKGGLIFTWSSGSAGSKELYANAVNTNGNIRYANKVIANATDDQYSPEICTDGSSGAYISWVDERRGSNYRDLYMQRVSYHLNPYWQTNGIAAVTAKEASNTPSFHIAIDKHKKIYLRWSELNTDAKYYVYAQRFNPGNGNRVWTNDTQISQALDATGLYRDGLTPQVSGFMTFYNNISAGSSNILGGQINAAGSLVFSEGTAGKNITSSISAANKYLLYNVCDEVNKTLLSWNQTNDASYDLVVQRVDSSGNLAWGASGVTIATGLSGYTNDGGQNNSSNIIADGYGSLLAIFFRNGGTASNGLYVQKVGNNDTSKPILKGINIKNRQTFRRGFLMKVKAYDKQSGIYRVDYYLDKNLYKTMYKNLKATLSPSRVKKGRRTLKVIVWNAAGVGKSLYRTIYIR
ncbi:MAG: hypothetical protein C4562_03070 [Actinobacteria bacterium]|nr:MAG: hypothetical protein C4562_03070 [Actinomycetota bacterium]